MGLFGGKSKSKRHSSDPGVAELKKSMVETLDRQELLIGCLRALLVIVKAFSFNLKEIGADEFKSRLDGLMSRLEEGDTSSRFRAALEDEKAGIMEFIAREQAYFDEREQELKKIIELLMEGIKQMVGDNREFTARVEESNHKIETVTNLDDIRKIRETIKSEVHEMRRVIVEKQSKERCQVDSLTREVDGLRTDLEKAEIASLTDGLTGAENRLSFDRKVKDLVERSLVTYAPFSLLLCDLDNFKSINDNYGHPVGDRVLKAFVQECRNVFRKEDVIARYGGEEFAIILHNAPQKVAMKRAQALCKSVAGRSYMVDQDHPERVLSFTVSVGVAFLQKKDTVKSLVERADAALYKAKHEGKNQAVAL